MPADRQDLIADYLRELGTRLRTPDADLVLAETEDHLRESVAAGLAVGMTEREAQEAAISAFGPVRPAHRPSLKASRSLRASPSLSRVAVTPQA